MKKGTVALNRAAVPFGIRIRFYDAASSSFRTFLITTR